jgi:Uma2 family endonuclease
MRAVIAVVSEDFLAQRKRTGADRYDEMWQGVLHVAPVPTRAHQDFEFHLESYLRSFWAPSRDGKVYHQINVAPVGGWPSNYRVPDVVLLLPQRFAIDRDEYFEGAPSAVVEIHSPGDESCDKLPFYFDLGVPEVWIIHRDTKAPEIYVPGRKKYRLQRANGSGWIKGPQTQVELKHAAPDKFAIRVNGDDTVERELPEY